MPYDPQSPPGTDTAADAAKASDRAAPLPLPSHAWKTAHREWLPYWQQSDPVPPQPETPPPLETPGEVLTERQEAFCRAYVECPVGAKAAVSAGYSPAHARSQASRLLKHPLVVRRLHELRDIRGKDFQVRRDTIIDQAEAVFEGAMERHDFYAAMQALTMKARLAGFADYLPGVRILRSPTLDYEQEFWARAHAAEQRIMAARLGDIAGGAPLGGGVDRGAVEEARGDAEMFAESAEAAAQHMAMRKSDEAERRARVKRRPGR